MKRIAIVHQEFLSEGMPAALHVNARTDRDWERWREYVAARPEVAHIAFEFGTGAGWGERMGWHTAQLAQLARAVNRPLHLVVRWWRPRVAPAAIGLLQGHAAGDIGLRQDGTPATRRSDRRRRSSLAPVSDGEERVAR